MRVRINFAPLALGALVLVASQALAETEPKMREEATGRSLSTAQSAPEYPAAQLVPASAGIEASLDATLQPGVGFRAPLRLGDQELTLEMKPFSVRSSSFELRVQQPDGSLAAVSPPPVSTLRGRLLEIPDSLVVGSVTRGALQAQVFLPSCPGQWLSLESVGPSAVGSFRGLDGQRGLMTCSGRSRPEDRTPVSLGGTDCASLGFCLAEVVADSDSMYYSEFDPALGPVEEQILTVVEGNFAMVNARWEQEFNITHRLLTVVVRPDSATDPYVGAGTWGTLLARVREQWLLGVSPPDLAHLFTAQALTPGTVLGEAWVGGVCGTANPTQNSASATLRIQTVNCSAVGVSDARAWPHLGC